MSISQDDFKHLTKQFENSLKASGKQASTVDSYRRDAECFLNYLKQEGIGLSQVEAQTLVDFQTWTSNYDKENSIRRKMIGARIFFRFLSAEVFKTVESPLDTTAIPTRNEALYASKYRRSQKYSSLN